MDADSVRWKNDHNVHVATGLATQEQLQASVDVFKVQLDKLYPGQGYDKVEYIVNLVTNEAGISFKYAYLWVSDPRVYHILTGMNPDGSERFAEEEKPKVKDEDDFDLDDMNLENAFSVQTVNKVPTIQLMLPPILTIPGYEYTEEQKLKAEEDLKAAALKEGKGIEDIVVPQFGYFKTTRAWAGSTKEEENPCILRGEVPMWTTEDMLKKIFSRYSSDKSGMWPRITFKNTTKIDYKTKVPVNIKIALVEYSKTYSRDGIFALQMTRKIYLKDPVEEAKVREILRKNPSVVIEPLKPVVSIWKHLRNRPEYDDPKDNGKNYQKKGNDKGKFFR